MTRALTDLGADARVEVERCAGLARNGGKAQLVVAAADPLTAQLP